MKTDTAEYAYRRCGELLELFLRHRGEPIEPLSDDDVNIAEGLIRCGMVTGECSKSVVLANSVTPAGLEYLDTIKGRVWWRRLLKGAGVAILGAFCALAGSLWQRVVDFAFDTVERSYLEEGKPGESEERAQEHDERIQNCDATAP